MKKILIGIYVLIIIGIVVAISNSHIFNNKESKAITAGENVYKKQCLVCHGETGFGEGAKVGTALNNQNFLNTVSDTDLYHYVKYGREEAAMPAYGSRLSDRDLHNLVAFMRNWQTEKIDFSAPKTILGNRENGKKLYNLYCMNCHGEAGSGRLKMGPAVANPNYLKYTTDQQIWISTAYGREKTVMASSLKGLDGVRQLTQNNISDIVTYIRSLAAK